MDARVVFLLCGTAATSALATPTKSNGPTDQLAGSWRGRSLCVTTTRPACSDETVVYVIRKDSPGGDGFHIQADKIVNGERQNMGELVCRFEPTRQQLVRPMGAGKWQFRWDGDMLVGGLMDTDGAFRFVQVRKDKS